MERRNSSYYKFNIMDMNSSKNYTRRRDILRFRLASQLKIDKVKENKCLSRVERFVGIKVFCEIYVKSRFIVFL